jgi:hypothetical protein
VSKPPFDDESGHSLNQVGLVLRMVGPLVQIVCIMMLLRPGVGEWTVGGTPIRPLLYGSFVGGLALVLLGLALSSRSTRR